MTTFIFMLTPNDGPAAVERMLASLEAAFPLHEFLAGDADIGGYENNILAIHGSAGSEDEPGTVVLPNTDEVADVAAAFAGILRELRDWKPS